MKIAVNYSNALIGLLSKDPDLPIDFIKVPTMPFPDCWSQFEQGKMYRPLLPHLAQIGVIALGHPNESQRFNFETIKEVLDWTNPPYLSGHLEARVEYFPELEEYQHQNHPKVKERLKKHFLAAISAVKGKITIPLVLENFPYYTWWSHFQWGSDPEFIAAICHEGDCGFLLDIAHARCSAWYMQKDLLEYINTLPLDRLKEIHLAGLQMRVEGMRDTHTALTAEDYQLYKYLLQRTKPEIVTIEYGGMPEQIMNLERNYEPISRNNPWELKEMILRVKKEAVV